MGEFEKYLDEASRALSLFRTQQERKPRPRRRPPQQPQKRREQHGGFVAPTTQSPKYEVPPLIEPEVWPTFEGFMNEPSSKEVEASFGRYLGDRFSPGVMKSSFFFLLNHMRTVLENFFDEKIRESKEFRVGDLREILVKGRDPLYQRKIRENLIDSVPWGVRIRLSDEQFISLDDISENDRNLLESFRTREIASDEEVILDPDTCGVIRTKVRYSFTANDNSDFFKSIRLDLTYVIEDNMFEVHPCYEVEIERLSSRFQTSRFIRLIKFFKLLLQNILPIFNHETGFPMIVSNNLQGEDMLILGPEYSQISRLYNNLFFRANVNNNVIGKFFRWENKPRSIRPRELFNPNIYAITLKYDGVRKFLFITRIGGAVIQYLVYPPYEIQKMGPGPMGLEGTLIDGELMEEERGQPPTFFAFDILFLRGRDVRGLNLQTRLESLSTSVGNQPINPNLNFRLKTFYIGERTKIQNAPRNIVYVRRDYYDAADIAESAEAKDIGNGRKIDGWILQPRNAHYRNDKTWKWKPPEMLTIDFYLELIPGTNDIFNLFVRGKNERNEIFKGTEMNPYNGYQRILFPEFPPGEINGQVVEMSWDFGTESFRPIRMRVDRPAPNYTGVALDVWRDIQRPIYKETILGRDLRVVRAFLNDQKSEFIKTYISNNDKILDIGSGRGGDLAKWKSLNLTAYAVDPNLENLDVMKKREKTLKYPPEKIHYITGSGDETDMIVATLKGTNVVKWKVDAITLFFSLQFFSGDRLKRLMKTFSTVLVPGGVVVGIVTDGIKMREELEIEGVDDTLEGSSWKLVKTGENTVQVTIHDPDSMVKDQDEYLFNFEEFHGGMARRGFKLDKSALYCPQHGFPTDGNRWLRMQRYFAFRRQNERGFPGLQMLAVGDVRPLKTVFEKQSLRRFGVIADGSCYFHSLLMAISRKYQQMSIEDRQKYVYALRENLAGNLTYEIYLTLGNGELANFNTGTYGRAAANPKNASRLGWAMYLRVLGSKYEWVGLEVQEYVSNMLGIDIYVLWDTTRDIYNSAHDLHIIYKNRPSVVLISMNDGRHFEPIGRKAPDGTIQTLFPPDDPWIRELYSKE